MNGARSLTQATAEDWRRRRHRALAARVELALRVQGERMRGNDGARCDQLPDARGRVRFYAMPSSCLTEFGTDDGHQFHIAADRLRRAVAEADSSKVKH
jgi:hypothetical protein